MLGKASKNYWISRGNHDKHVAPALAFAAAQAHRPTQDWRHQCLSFVRQSLGAEGMGGTAVDAWNRNLHPDRTHSWYAPPPGVPIFWAGGAGHIVLASATPGYCWSSDVRGPGTVAHVTVAEVSRWLGSGHKYLGWADTVNGVAILA